MCSKESDLEHKVFTEWIQTELNDKKFTENILFLDSLLKTGAYSGDELGIITLKKGGQYSKKEIYTEAIKHYEKSLSIFNKTKNEVFLTKINYQLGSTYVFLGENQKATQHLLISLDFAKKRNDKDYEAVIYDSFAHLYYSSKDYDKSIEHLLKEEKIHQEKGNKKKISATYNNIAVIYKNMMNLNLAIKYNNLSLKISEEINDISGIAKSYNNLGQAYELLENRDTAILFYKNSIRLNNETKIHNTTPLRNLSKIYLEKSRYDSAIILSKKAIAIETNNNYLQEIYSYIISSYEEKKDEKSASIYSRKLDSVQVLIDKSNNDQKLNMIENQYKAAASEQELIQTKKNNNKNRIIFIIALVLLIILGLFFYQRNKNSKLKLAKEKLILEQRVLRSQMNPHFIFNALSAIQNSLMNNEPLKTASYLSKFAKLIRQNFDFINQRFISLSEEIDSLKNYMDTQKLRFVDKFDYEFDLDSDLNLDEVKIPPLLLQPFIENAIEHGFKSKKEKGLIKIKIEEEQTKIIYSISDDGIGYDVTKKDKKEHALDVFKKRMKLIGEEESSSFKIYSDNKGTSLTFSLKKQ